MGMVSAVVPSMTTVEGFSARLAEGRPLFVAGDEALLRRLPRGNWAGGTSAYFLADEGGLRTHERLFVAEIPEFALGTAIKVYDAASIASVYSDAPDNGYSLIVIPAGGRTLRAFALNGPRYENFACRPLVGWVSGVALEAIGKAEPKVIDGRSGRVLGDAAIVMHVSLPKTKTAEAGIVNIFEPGQGDVLTFSADGFSAAEVIVNGEPRSFVGYLKERGLDTRLPLVADYNGAMVNTSFQAVDEVSQEVRFYAPVFRGVKYRHARPIKDYVGTFSSQFSECGEKGVAFSCNCILNYVHAGLEGRRIPGFAGPATFGEIAYQLLNQTLVYLKISDTDLSARLRGEAALRKQLVEMEAVTKGLEMFNSMVSHDLRAPLRHMREFSKLLEASPAASGDALARGYARSISAAADKMTGLLDGLLSLARAGQAELRRASVDLSELAAEIQEELRPECEGRRVVWDVPPLPMVLGDRVLLKQVLCNLLGNAVKFTRGRPEARVEIRARQGSGQTVITVSDNGAGFDPQVAGRMFEPFQRLVSTDEFAGSGLGLAIAARIVARHGGRIWADAREGAGASFSFSLPDG